MSTPTELVLGRYRALRRLAVGGMGEVFLGEDLDGTRVVLKTMLPELAADRGFVTQFLEEAKLCARLEHPNIVRQLAQGWWSGAPILVLEYVRGRTVAQLIRKMSGLGVPLPLEVVAQLGADAARGLAAAHRAVDDAGQPLHIVHRDVSPQNLMVGLDGRVRVLDFGIALSTERSVRTTTGVVRGKAAYLSPEQIRRSGVTSSADQFALGVVLWEAATGQRLFRGEGDALFLEVLERPIPLPSSAGGPGELDAVVSRMLERDLALRFPSLDAVAERLEALAGEGGRQAVAALMARLGEDDLDVRADSPIVVSSGAETRTAQVLPEGLPSPSPAATVTRLAGLVAAALVAWAGGVAAGGRFEDVAIDALLRWRGPIPVSDEVVHVDIDDEAIQTFGRWPWSRALQARLVTAIAQARPRAAVFDLVWCDPSTPEDDEALRVALAGVEHRVLPSIFEARVGWLHPLPALQAGSTRAHNLVEIDDDGRWRRVSAELDAGTPLPHLSLALSRLLERPEPRPAADGRLRVNWPGQWSESFTHVPAGALLRGEGGAALSGKTVVMAVTAWGHADRRSTAWEREVPSPFVHSSLLSAAWTGRQLRDGSPTLQAAVLGSLLVVVLLLGWRRGASWAAGAAGVALLAWSSVSALAFSRDLVLWTARPALALLGLVVVFGVEALRVRR